MGSNPTLSANKNLRRAVGRLLHVDDEERIGFYRALATAEGRPRLEAFTERQRRLARLLVASLGERVLGKRDSLAAAVDLLWQHAQVRAELGEFFGALQKRIDHVHSAIDSHLNIPLQIHARYSRNAIFLRGLPDVPDSRPHSNVAR